MTNNKLQWLNGDVIVELGNCLNLMKSLNDCSIDLVVTSPPYDDLRLYDGYKFEFELIAIELYRILKDGGTIIWVVGDSTKDGTESCTSFKQCLYFKEIGFNLYDTMIYQKSNYTPLNHRRYEQEFEYMFVLTKGKPKAFNPIMIPCKYAGEQTWGSPTTYNKDGTKKQVKKHIIGDTKIHGNIFCYQPNRDNKTKGHPAPFPIQLTDDMVSSWSNEGDLVLDCFLGSGTTALSCIKLNRKFIGYEISNKYIDIAKKRIDDYVHKKRWNLI